MNEQFNGKKRNRIKDGIALSSVGLLAAGLSACSAEGVSNKESEPGPTVTVTETVEAEPSLDEVFVMNSEQLRKVTGIAQDKAKKRFDSIEKLPDYYDDFTTLEDNTYQAYSYGQFATAPDSAVDIMAFSDSARASIIEGADEDQLVVALDSHKACFNDDSSESVACPDPRTETTLTMTFSGQNIKSVGQIDKAVVDSLLDDESLRLSEIWQFNSEYDSEGTAKYHSAKATISDEGEVSLNGESGKVIGAAEIEEELVHLLN